MKKSKNLETLYFIGGLFPREREDEIRRLTKSGLQSAANNLQWKFVKGYDSCLGTENVHLINSEYVGSFPKRYSGIFVPRYSFRHSEISGEDVGPGFVNLPVLKEFSRAARLCSEIDKVNPRSCEQLYFVGYAATYPIVTALHHAKKKFPNSIVALIVPDLPQYMELGSRGTGFLHRLKNHFVSKGMKGMDCYVPLTAAMAPYLGVDLTKCAVVEGIADEHDASEPEAIVRDLPERYILYTGTLQYRYGLGELISAFKGLDDTGIGLVVCGDGEAANEMTALQSENPMVRYLGVLPSQEIEGLRNGATILVNPRKNEGDYTKFSFPSKMMEFLASGVPTVAYRLDGMPEDYEGLFIDATDGGLKAALNRALAMDPEELHQLSLRAKTYVIDHKGSKDQCARTLELFRKESTYIER